MEAVVLRKALIAAVIIIAAILFIKEGSFTERPQVKIIAKDSTTPHEFVSSQAPGGQGSTGRIVNLVLGQDDYAKKWMRVEEGDSFILPDVEKFSFPQHVMWNLGF